MYATEPDYCDPGRCLDEQEREDPTVCAECGVTPIYIVSVAWLGIFCSRRCANIASVKHEAATGRMRETA